MPKLSLYLYDESKKMINSMKDGQIKPTCVCSDSANESPVLKFDPDNEEMYIQILGSFLNETIQRNDRCRPDQLHETSNRKSLRIVKAFNGEHPGFLASYYVDRIHRYAGASSCCFISALVYLERMQRIIPYLNLTSFTLQRLFLVAVMTAEKFLEDIGNSNLLW